MVGEHKVDMEVAEEEDTTVVTAIIMQGLLLQQADMEVVPNLMVEVGVEVVLDM